MLTFDFTTDDLARTRFAISPLWELVAGLRLLRTPDRAGPHLPWVKEVLPRAAELKEELATTLALLPPSGYIPDFVSPPPTSPVEAFSDEVASLRATDPEVARYEIDLVIAANRSTARLRKAREDPATTVGQVADSLERWWDIGLADRWPRVQAALDADLTHRARRLTQGGPAALFADLARDTAWRGDRLEVDMRYEGREALEGRGLVIVPSAFAWTRPSAMASQRWQPTLFYPVRGLELLWEPGEPAPDALAGVLGRSRADLLTRLDAPRSTTELARQTALTPGGASQHLKALKAAGLVSATRQGREVLYLRTELADRLQESAAT